MTLSTINTVQFKPLILWINEGYGTGVKIPTPPACYKQGIVFYIWERDFGRGAYYLWGACCMRGNTVKLPRLWTTPLTIVSCPIFGVTITKRCSRLILQYGMAIGVESNCISDGPITYAKVCTQSSDWLMAARISWPILHCSKTEIYVIVLCVADNHFKRV